MKKVIGGDYRHLYITSNSMYTQSKGYLTEGYNGNFPAHMYYRKMKTGSTSLWINYTLNGYTYKGYGAENTRLINLYGKKAKWGVY